MDDTNTPSIGLDLNPDMITPHPGNPAATSAPSAPIAPDPTPAPAKGIIDITPGAKEEFHTSPVTDITPQASVTVTTPGMNLPVDKGVIDITPDEKPASLMEETSGSAHLADLVPQSPSAPAVTETAPAPVVSMPAPSAPAAPDPAPVTPDPTPAPVAPQAPVQASPLQEDPNLVVLGK